jgi:glycosyltransferase involved in cell wall biosynthesis
MSIVIFGDAFSFPEGNAATNRVYTYAKGFIENGINVHIICFTSEYLDNCDGTVDGIKYYHPFGQQLRNKYFIIRRLQKLLKYYKTFQLIKAIFKVEKIIALNNWSELFITNLFAWFLTRVFKMKLIIECSEHPLRRYQNGIFKKMLGFIKFNIEARLFDGAFCISSYLIDFYQTYRIKQRKLFLVPSTVDPSRFIKVRERPFAFRYIGYFGSLTIDRDNVDLLIRSFANISNFHSDVHLILGGFCPTADYNIIISLISDLNINSKVILLGYLSRNEITRYITHADILVMVRKRDIKSQASFPSKLTEYLSTALPVVTVKTGEISDYLTDNINAFVVDPGDCDALTKKIDFVLRNYDYAKKVGNKGKELTDTIFNYKVQAKRMIDFIYMLN